MSGRRTPYRCPRLPPHRKEELPTKDKEYYTIGEVGKICNISAKALRYYDKIGVISPDYICEENGYRYYSRKTLLTVPVMKYYKQMGFKLEEMQELYNRRDIEK